MAGSDRASTYAEILRVLGQILDANQGQSAEIVAREGVLVLSWRPPQGPRQQRSFLTVDLKELHERALRMRAGLAPRPSGDRSELLRTLGQDLDQLGVRLDRVVEARDGYRVVGMLNGEMVGQWFPVADLRAASHERRALRNVTPSRRSLTPVARPRTRPPRPRDEPGRFG